MRIFLSILFSFLINFYSTNIFAEKSIDYNVFLGGIQIANVNFLINSDENSWLMESKVEAAGIVDVFVKFIAITKSSGTLVDNLLVPDQYSFSYQTGNGSSRTGEIKYEKGIPIELNAEPDYDESEKPKKEFMEKYGKGSNDPYSALLVPGHFKDPCSFIAHGFDGLRSFKTVYVRPAKKENIKINDINYSAKKCIGYFDPIVGYRESDFLEEVSKPGAVRYWYNFFEEENLWIPIKIIIDTPLGGFVLKAKNIANNPLTKEEVR